LNRAATIRTLFVSDFLNLQQTGIDMQPKITAMLVMARERRLSLLEALDACGIHVLPVGDCNEARRVLETQPRVQVVLTDTALPDGDWREVLQIVAQGRADLEVVICSRLSDHRLWNEVLERGAYDVLVEAFPCEEMRRILEAAVARSYMRSLPAAKTASHKPKVARAAGAP
jgi:DNA-binding NtrC family response regulator